MPGQSEDWPERTEPDARDEEQEMNDGYRSDFHDRSSLWMEP